MYDALDDDKRSLLNRNHYLPRPSPSRRKLRSLSYLTRVAAIFLLILVLLTYAVVKVDDARERRLKAIPTDFTRLHQISGLEIKEPEKNIRYFNGTHIDDRYALIKALGEGREGSAAKYLDFTTDEIVVVKTFTGPARNQLPDSLADGLGSITSTWPAEIEATYLMSNMSGFVPLSDFFILQHSFGTSGTPPWTWAMATKFVTGGTLSKLAADVADKKSPDELDQQFRQHFQQFLTSLQHLHDADLCHDDMKPDNMFISSPDQWLVGDLGNARQVSHRWHTTRDWMSDYETVADCRVYDVLRAMRSYLSFLRYACSETAEFDRHLLDNDRSWSTPYWNFMSNPMTASELSQALDHDISTKPGQKPSISRFDWLMRRLSVGSIVRSELTCTAAHGKCISWTDVD